MKIFIVFSKLIKIFYLFTILFLIFLNPVQAQEDPPARPEWWNEINIDVPRKNNVVEQYYSIKGTFLDPAYRATGGERELLFKRSIVAYSKLLEWFQSDKDRPTACLAEYQVAEAYRQIGDIHMANASYQKCIAYQAFLNDPPNTSADTTMMAIISNSRIKLGDSARE